MVANIKYMGLDAQKQFKHNTEKTLTSARAYVPVVTSQACLAGSPTKKAAVATLSHNQGRRDQVIKKEER